jgi:hypothetical protein
MDPSLHNLLFSLLFGLAVAWLVLVKLLFVLLEQSHPERYDAMGRPSLILRHSPSGVFNMLRFLILRQHRTFGDKMLSRLADGMLCFLVIYLLLFFGLVFLGH